LKPFVIRIFETFENGLVLSKNVKILLKTVKHFAHLHCVAFLRQVKIDKRTVACYNFIVQTK